MLKKLQMDGQPMLHFAVKPVDIPLLTQTISVAWVGIDK